MCKIGGFEANTDQYILTDDNGIPVDTYWKKRFKEVSDGAFTIYKNEKKETK